MEFLDPEYVEAMNMDPIGDPLPTFPFVDECSAFGADDGVAMMPKLVRLTFSRTCPEMDDEGNTIPGGEFRHSEEAE